jgi:hypothetical protein
MLGQLRLNLVGEEAGSSTAAQPKAASPAQATRKQTTGKLLLGCRRPDVRRMFGVAFVSDRGVGCCTPLLFS